MIYHFFDYYLNGDTSSGDKLNEEYADSLCSPLPDTGEEPNLEVNDIEWFEKGEGKDYNYLQGHWKLDNEGGNIEAIDSSGYDNHGVLHGPGYTVGYSGFASYFDGVDDYIQIPDDPSLNFHDTNKFSISAWVKRDGSLISTHESIVCKGITEVDQGYLF